ncbi:13482_t:CDS:2, partial [Racocetra persica]
MAHAQAIHSSFFGFVWTFQFTYTTNELSHNHSENYNKLSYENLKQQIPEYLASLASFPWYFGIPPLISYTMIKVIHSNSCTVGFYVANLALSAFYLVGCWELSRHDISILSWE